MAHTHIEIPLHHEDVAPVNAHCNKLLLVSQIARKPLILAQGLQRVNDVHGHQAGDDAILFLRDMMMEFSRPGDVISRLGGDEFAMWLDGITPQVTEKRATALIEASKAMLQFSGDEDHPLGISVGIANYDPADNEPLDELLARADHAMYAAKNAGKSGFKVAPPAGTPIETPEH